MWALGKAKGKGKAGAKPNPNVPLGKEVGLPFMKAWPKEVAAEAEVAAQALRAPRMVMVGWSWCGHGIKMNHIADSLSLQERDWLRSHFRRVFALVMRRETSAALEVAAALQEVVRASIGRQAHQDHGEGAIFKQIWPASRLLVGDAPNVSRHYYPPQTDTQAKRNAKIKQKCGHGIKTNHIALADYTINGGQQAGLWWKED